MLGSLLKSCSTQVTASVSFVGSSDATNSNSIDLTGISGLQTDDYVIFAFSDDATSFSMSSSGWSAMSEDFPNSKLINSIRNIAGYKQMGDPVDTTVTISTAVDVGIAIAFRGISNPPSLPTASESTGSTNTFDVGSMSVTSDGSVSLIIAMHDEASATITATPSGYTLAATASSTTNSMAIFYKLDVASGTENPGAGVWSASSDSLYTAGYIIAPA